jgi:hypothetical protein
MLNRIEAFFGPEGRKIIGNIIQNMYDTGMTEEQIKTHIKTYEQIAEQNIYELPASTKSSENSAPQAGEVRGNSGAGPA